MESLNLRVLSWSVRETKNSVLPLALCPQDEQSNTRLFRIASHGEVEPCRSPLAGFQAGESRFVPGLFQFKPAGKSSGVQGAAADGRPEQAPSVLSLALR